MITTRVTYVCSIGLFALLACGIVLSMWTTEEIGYTALHSPAGFLIAGPFIVLFAIGALILAVLVIRSRLSALQTVVGLLPIVAVVLGLFGIGLLSLA